MVTEREKITMLHGAGGAVMHNFVKEHIVKSFGGLALSAEVPLEAMDDAAVIGDIVFKSDSHAVKPLFFPGGDIGRLSISGTVNDISALGAEPYALASGFVLEEGLSLDDLDRILESMRQTLIEADVGIVTGDTKVVEKGSLGGCVMNVSGIGKRSAALENNLQTVKKYRSSFSARWTLDSNLVVGDKIILSGTIGDHGLAVLSAQRGLNFGSNIVSDVKPLNKVIQRVMCEVGGVVTMKDPTRGGLADALNEFAEKSKVGVLLYEDRIPIRKDVVVACEMLGLDPLEIGNEGKMLFGVVPQKADEALAFLTQIREGKDAQIIGEVTDSFRGVAMQTVVGGKRIIARPIGDPVPRIC
ncbi:MAG: hydrogenase expression/formation protein HypE [Candidatus Bathyarchaeota archaeon]|nr:hydrogenase expression/formation protein HypE [Candidatus Termiticorpusculum sp.]MCL1970976.1 hydrogenase expression/formation protein HypE [Candidatus Termiticorpusculum sp.]